MEIPRCAGPDRFLACWIMASAVHSGAESAQAAGIAASLGRRAWVALSGALAAVLGLLPHVLHHAGLLAGAFFAGAAGSVLFGAIGFLAAIPFLVRIRRRTGSWRLPATLLALLAVMFSFSTFVLGPAINGDGDSKSSSSQGAPAPTDGKDAHGHDH